MVPNPEPSPFAAETNQWIQSGSIEPLRKDGYLYGISVCLHLCICIYIYIYMLEICIYIICIYVYREKGKSIYKKTQKIRNIMQCNIYISVHLNICIYMYTRNFVWAAIKGYGLSSHLRIALFDHLLDAQKNLYVEAQTALPIYQLLQDVSFIQQYQKPYSWWPFIFQISLSTYQLSIKPSLAP